MTNTRKQSNALTRMAALAAMAMLMSGCTLFTWGSNGFGQLGTGDTTPSSNPGETAPGSFGETWQSINAGWKHTCGIKTDSTAWCWGNNGSGQLGNNSTINSSVPVQEHSASTWIMIVAGTDYTCGIKTDSTAWCWGDNNSGRLGTGGGATTVPTQEASGSTWSTIDAQWQHTCGVRLDATLWCWGRNADRQLAVGSGSAVPVQEETAGLWIDVTVGADHSCGVRANAEPWCWGTNSSGQLGINGSFFIERNPPEAVHTDLPWTEIGAGTRHNCGLKANREIWCFGRGLYGQLGDGGGTVRRVPVREATRSFWNAVSAGMQRHACGIRTDDTAWCWGYGFWGGLGTGNTANSDSPVQEQSRSSWSSISAGYDHTCGIKLDGTAWCWGTNDVGQLGTGNTVRSLTAAPVTGGATPPRWIAVSAGGAHTCRLGEDFTIWCAGNNANGQLGLGSDAAAHTVFTRLSSGTAWKNVSAGDTHTCAVASDNTLWCWGNNADGQLGTNNTVSTNTPIQVGTDTHWVTVAAGGTHTCAITATGTMYCWGSNSSGKLGNGTIVASLAPSQVSGGDAWVRVATGANNTCALRATGSAACWGQNVTGAVGAGTTGGNALVPVDVDTTLTFTAIDVGSEHGCAISTTKTLHCWGDNFRGQLGIGASPLVSNRPVQVGSDADWNRITAGNAHTCAIRAVPGDDTLWCWGINNSGQLGTGDTTNTNTPTQTGLGVSWADVDAGTNHTAGLAADTN